MKAENSILQFTRRYWSVITVGVFGCVGFYCLVNYLAIATFHEVSKHPNGFPASIIGGMISLIICIAAGFLWIGHISKEEKKGKFFLLSLVIMVVAFLAAFFGIGIFGHQLRF